MSIHNELVNLTNDLEIILGLDSLESKTYLNLLRTGPITASALAKELDVDRARMYRTVDKLVSRNILSTTISSPKLCIAAEPKLVLKIALNKKQDEVSQIIKSGETIINKINNQISYNEIKRVPMYKTTQGRQNVYADISQLVETCTDIIYIITTLEDVSRMYYSTIPEKITICEKNGGKVRLLVDLNDTKLAPFVKRFNATETRIGKIPSKGRMIVQKNKKMLLSDSTINENQPNSNNDYSISISSVDMIDNLFELCNFLWKSSKPLSGLKIENFTNNHQ